MPHAIFCETGKGAAELRIRQSVMATTADARRNQRISYTAPRSKPVATVTPINEDFRDL